MTSYVHPTFFYNGQYFLLIFTPVLLVQLSCLTVGRTVGVRLIQKTLYMTVSMTQYDMCQ